MNLQCVEVFNNWRVITQYFEKHKWKRFIFKKLPNAIYPSYKDRYVLHLEITPPGGDFTKYPFFYTIN